MKSAFAKFIDGTIGAALIFIAAAAIARYYLPISLSLFTAAAVTSAIFLLRKCFAEKKRESERISKAASLMFYDFMFLSDDAPCRALCRGLTSRGLAPVKRGNGLYTGKTAAYFYFDAPPSEKACARIIARAQKYGCNRAVVFCRSQPQTVIEAPGFDTKYVCGEDVYKLFASLGCLPEHKYGKSARPRFYAYRSALSCDKIIKYAALSAFLFWLATVTRHGIVPFVCAAACAALCIASIAVAVINAHKKRIGK